MKVEIIRQVTIQNNSVSYLHTFNLNIMANENNRGNGQGGNTSNRGFASMDPERQREIASKGGKAAHESGNAHEFDSEEAREAGRKGGMSRGNNSGGNEGGRGNER
jgi:uncharacterized protein